MMLSTVSANRLAGGACSAIATLPHRLNATRHKNFAHRKSLMQAGGALLSVGGVQPLIANHAFLDGTLTKRALEHESGLLEDADARRVVGERQGKDARQVQASKALGRHFAHRFGDDAAIPVRSRPANSPVRQRPARRRSSARTRCRQPPGCRPRSPTRLARQVRRRGRERTARPCRYRATESGRGDSARSCGCWRVRRSRRRLKDGNHGQPTG